MERDETLHQFRDILENKNIQPEDAYFKVRPFGGIFNVKRPSYENWSVLAGYQPNFSILFKTALKPHWNKVVKRKLL